MTFAIHGLAVARGIAIGRAVLVASSRVDVAHYFIDPTKVEAEIDRIRNGRRVNAKSIMGIMMLAAGLGSEVELETEGEDEQQAAEAIAALVNDKFGEGQ